MSAREEDRPPRLTSAAAARAAFFFAFWLAISGWKAGDLPVGLAGAVAAAWTSLGLLPAKVSRLRLGGLAALAFSFARGSVVSGFDVARRALRPQLDLRPGFVTAPLRLPPGSARNAFCSRKPLARHPSGRDERRIASRSRPRCRAAHRSRSGEGRSLVHAGARR